ncbi:phosphotransferase [Yoonia sp. 208BN28-4]|uniref:phosphotransferase n=1 Tax=Yoonia sp. 208BN28-4 TaxID=3126505 RepID=UPI0030984A5B
MTDAAPGLGISHAALNDYLTTHVPDFAGLLDVRKFDKGQSNPTYLITADSGPLVLRSQPAGRLLPSAHRVDREYRVMRALADTKVPVPSVHCLADADTSPSSRAFYVMAHLDGRIFWDPALPDTTDRGGIYDAMNTALAALHDVDVAQAGLSDFGKPGNYYARQLERWAGQYRASIDEPLAEMTALIDWLEQALPEDDGQVALVHGDYRLDNMIFAPQAADIMGVLDWELSTLGHPMADLSYQCMQWRLPNQGDMRGLGGVDRAALGLPTEADYVADYMRKRGLGSIDNWPFYLCFSFFRLAAILAGVAARARQGNASNPEMARKYGQAVPQLAAMALAITRDGA